MPAFPPSTDVLCVCIQLAEAGVCAHVSTLLRMAELSMYGVLHCSTCPWYSHLPQSANRGVWIFCLASDLCRHVGELQVITVR